ncbi:MAG: tRNA guanosine(15) transglycosylase TgtA, partial [Candidatus Bathyarchaeia archaeon]
MTDKDVLGRVGRLHTKKGVIETPCLLPVIHPSSQSVHPSEMWEMGFKGVMTNAYLAYKAFGPETEV